MTLEEARKLIGHAVIWYPPEWTNGYNGVPSETGVITSVNDKYVFVRYGSDTGSKATAPEDVFTIGRGRRA